MNQKPTVAELAKTLVHYHYHGVISTLATDGGYPYGSVIDYLPLSQGDVVVLLHEKAEHYRYLSANPKASLLVNAHLAEHEALHIPRVTLLGEARAIEDGQELVRDYLVRHPDAEPYISLDGLHFFQLDVSGARYIAGSGRAVWLDATDYRAASPDPLGDEAPWLVQDLNEHRHNDLVLIARNLREQEWVEEARVVSVDRLGFDMICHGQGTRHAIRVGFDSAASDRKAFDQACRKLVARAILLQE
ncbi:MAG: pyridoxamine 5'-phosphate oxidase family protein [Xanthomonadales bacterium]|nr:pyridoxamine 5'-phosphate oxidase family protein [Xanthomonadales bacterium]